jgi:hypothetical protein
MHDLLTGSVQLFTFKKGLLSKIAHDLRLVLKDCEVRREGLEIDGCFRPELLEVEGAMKKGILDSTCLSQKDRRKIHRQMCTEILQTQTHPEVTLRGQLKNDFFEGHLRLRGLERPIACSLVQSGEQLEGRFEIRPSTWGIPPFKALLGAIQLQDRVEVRFRFAAKAASL